MSGSDSRSVTFPCLTYYDYLFQSIMWWKSHLFSRFFWCCPGYSWLSGLQAHTAWKTLLQIFQRASLALLCFCLYNLISSGRDNSNYSSPATILSYRVWKQCLESTASWIFPDSKSSLLQSALKASEKQSSYFCFWTNSSWVLAGGLQPVKHNTLTMYWFQACPTGTYCI